MSNLSVEDNRLVTAAEEAMGYHFSNAHLLVQAFTRKSDAADYDCEVLEFIGDRVVEYVITRNMVQQYGSVKRCPDGAKWFFSRKDEGEMTVLKSRFVSHEHLADRAAELMLSPFIRYGSGEQPSDAAAEDMIEAIIGAAAVDCNWDYPTLEQIVTRVLDFGSASEKKPQNWSACDALNSWHQKRFGKLPEYLLEVDAEGCTCIVRIQDPTGNQKYLDFTASDAGRSASRNAAAQNAKDYLEQNGLWLNLADAGIEPRLEDAINQLQELHQKKYIQKPIYEFERKEQWYCRCQVSSVSDQQSGRTKTEAKKRAAFGTLIRLMKASGLYDVAWSIELGDEDVSYADELTVFLRTHADANLEEKLDFIVSMQIKYDRILALQSYDQNHPSFITALGVNHRNIGISLCKMMGIDHKCLETWSHSARTMTDPEAYAAKRQSEKKTWEKDVEKRFRKFDFSGEEQHD